MRDKGVKQKTLGLVGKLVEKETKKVEQAWPPKCGALFHQPKRPKFDE
ncbi:MAG: cyclic lactone autoinducer peptide [Lachnospiraceae bacterium]|nr:cyclic lactone autoinducer peptide [Lachnospiraceae bacterium]